MKLTPAICLAVLIPTLMCCAAGHSQQGRGPSTPPPPNLYAVTVKVRGDLVNVRTYTATDQPGHIMHSFTEALKTHPHTRRIRVSWSMMLGMNEMDSTALYNRRTHSLLFYGEGGGDLGDY